MARCETHAEMRSRRVELILLRTKGENRRAVRWKSGEQLLDFSKARRSFRLDYIIEG